MPSIFYSKKQPHFTADRCSQIKRIVSSYLPFFDTGLEIALILNWLDKLQAVPGKTHKLHSIGMLHTHNNILYFFGKCEMI